MDEVPIKGGILFNPKIWLLNMGIFLINTQHTTFQFCFTVISFLPQENSLAAGKLAASLETFLNTL